METLKVKNYKTILIAFKSYYVVWKQIWLNDKDSSDVF